MNGAAISESSDEGDITDSNKFEDERLLRRRKWQGIKKRCDDELLGGDSTHEPLCRPDFRQGVDFELVGKETWSIISSHFSYDVELPKRQLQEQTVPLNTMNMSNSDNDSKSPDTDAKSNDMDTGSSVDVGHPASSMISEEEGSSKSDSGDDLVSFLLVNCCNACGVNLLNQIAMSLYY